MQHKLNTNSNKKTSSYLNRCYECTLSHWNIPQKSYTLVDSLVGLKTDNLGDRSTRKTRRLCDTRKMDRTEMDNRGRDVLWADRL